MPPPCPTYAVGLLRKKREDLESQNTDNHSDRDQQTIINNSNSNAGYSDDDNNDYQDLTGLDGRNPSLNHPPPMATLNYHQFRDNFVHS